MRLITGTRTAVNPMIDENFKEEVIKPIGKTKDAPAVNSRPFDGEETVINITAEVVSGWLPEALRRFGCCTCPRCMADASAEAFAKLPAVKFRVKTREDLAEADRLREQNKQNIMMNLVRIAVARKELPKHQQ